jgi:hypothetical protein
MATDIIPLFCGIEIAVCRPRSDSWDRILEYNNLELFQITRFQKRMGEAGCA